MWVLFALMILLTECFVIMKVATTSGGKKLGERLEKSFWECYIIFCLALPLVSLGVLLGLGVRPPCACGATGTVMLVNGIFTGVFVETGLEMDV